MTEYIDRKALCKILENWRDAYADVDDEQGWGLLEDVIYEVDAQTAADVAPVVHGRWDGNTCTACKLPWNYQMVQDADDWGYFDPMPDYCPNCGARMDGDDDALD